MKKLIYSIAVLGLLATACESKKPNLEPEIPVYPVTVPVKAATATSGGVTVEGVIDNNTHTIDFSFDAEGVNLAAVTVHIECAPRAKAEEFAEDKVVDLTKPYQFVVNNAVEDITFTLNARVLETTDPVLSAYAVSPTAGNIPGVVDNVAHKITFSFTAGVVTLSAVQTVIEFSPRAELKEGAFTEATIDLTSPYQFVCTDGVHDLTYTIEAEMAASSLVDNTLCKVVKDIPGEAPASDPEGIANGEYAQYTWDNKLLNDPAHLFDGIWMSKAEAYDEVGYNYFGQGFVSDAYSTWFVFDIGSKAQVDKIVIWPYYPYSQGHCPWKYEFYAYIGEGDVTASPWSANSPDWKLVAQDDLTEWYYEQRAVEAEKSTKYGTEEDHCTTGRTVTFDTSAPAAQFYCYHMTDNMYSLGKTDLFEWWMARTKAITISEFQIYAY